MTVREQLDMVLDAIDACLSDNDVPTDPTEKSVEESRQPRSSEAQPTLASYGLWGTPRRRHHNRDFPWSSGDIDLNL